MTPAELLQLRRETLETLSWRFGMAERCSPNWRDTRLGPCWWSPDKKPFGANEKELRLESDNGLALDALDKRCVANDWSFEVFGPVRHPQKPHLTGKYGVRIAKWDGMFYLPFIEEYSDKISEACCRALVASAKKDV